MAFHWKQVALVSTGIFFGLIFGVYLAVPFVPSDLTSKDDVSGFVPVEVRNFSDPRAVVLVVSAGRPSSLHAPTSGRLTRISCDSTESIESGTTPADIDGKSILAIHTNIPLWRSLEQGDKGEDVLSLQEELGRLGFDVPKDGEVGSSTVRAVSGLLGESYEWNSIVPLDRIAWLPTQSVAVAECSSSLGDFVNVNDSLVTFAPLGASLQVVQLPKDSIQGLRRVKFEDQTYEIGEDGVIANADAVKLISAANNANAVKDGRLTASLELNEPISVGSIPPSALYAISGSRACVMSPNGPVVVNPIASELGETFIMVSTSEEMPQSVEIAPDRAATCF